MHRALAEVTDARLDPDRRAWHRAQASPGPDEDVAAELEHSAGRAQARGGLAAAAAFLERATTLTLDPAQRASRALAAAQANIQAGAFDRAQDLLTVAEAGLHGDFQYARVDLVRAQLAFVTNRGSDAPALLLTAARRLEPIDAELSRATYLDALFAAIFAGRLASPGSGVLEIARATESAPPPPGTPRAPDLLLDGLAAVYNHGYPAGLPAMRTAITTFGAGMSAEEELQRLYLACVTALRVWDDERWDVLSARHVQLAREAGALSELPLALTSRAYLHLFSGDLTTATSLTREAHTAMEATGSNLAPYGALGVAALRGDEAAAVTLLEATMDDVTRRGEGVGITFAEWANAALNNGLGRYQDALGAARRATTYLDDAGSSIWPVVELIEAATRSGVRDAATDAYDRLAEMTSASRTDWALGLQARSQALLSDGEAAEHLYRESLTLLGRTRLRVDLARAHLLYGEWLRRQRRRSDAREQLRTANGMFEAIGMEAFAERASRELRATGEAARKRTPAKHEDLTAQEAQIARLAREGLSNPEIGMPAVHQRAHRPIPSAQGLYEARHHVPQPARACPTQRSGRRSTDSGRGEASVIPASQKVTAIPITGRFGKCRILVNQLPVRDRTYLRARSVRPASVSASSSSLAVPGALGAPGVILPRIPQTVTTTRLSLRIRLTFHALASDTTSSSPPVSTCQTGVATPVPSLRYVVKLTYLLRPISSMTLIG